MSGTAESKYANHRQVDPALAAESRATTSTPQHGLSIVGRLFIFLGFPTLVGFIGLYLGYLGSRNDPNRRVKFDTDFALPFVLALSMAIVIGFQTKGYTSAKPEPLVMWPKVKKRRKVIHKHVVVGEGSESTKSD